MSNMTNPPDDKQQNQSIQDSQPQPSPQITNNQEIQPQKQQSEEQLADKQVQFSSSSQLNATLSTQQYTSQDAGKSVEQQVNSEQSQSATTQAQAVASISEPTAVAAAKNLTQKCCENCGFELDGPFCGRCGQPERTTIKFFGTVVLHFLDDLFGFDSRAGRTIFPLVFRPGFLTREYFRGRRVHYVPPLRLYIFVSIMFFLMLEFFTDDSVKELRELQQANGQESVAAINKQLNRLEEQMLADNYQNNEFDERQLANLREQKSKMLDSTQAQIDVLREGIKELNPQQLPIEQLGAGEQMAIKAIEQNIAGLQMNLDANPNYTGVRTIQNQLAQLEKKKQGEGGFNQTEQKKHDALQAQLTRLLNEDVHESNQVDKLTNKQDDQLIRFNIKPNFLWLSAEQNKQLELFFSEMENKAKVALEQDATPLVTQVLGVLPQMMFFLLPIFALILKIFYLFSRRYYMEHLTVALHSHSFIFVVLMLLATISSGYDYFQVTDPTTQEVVEWIIFGLVFWMPIYLFLMQKRVYRQGLFMTLCKYFIVGITYFMLLFVATLIAFFWGLAHI